MTEQRATSLDDTSWAPATGGFFADDTPFGSVLGDPLMGSPLFDVSVLDATPGTQPEDDNLYQDRSGLSEEERTQVARADRIKAGAARRDSAHRQAHGTARRPRRPQPPQQVTGPGAQQYGSVPTAPSAFQQPAFQQPVQRPVPQHAPGYGAPPRGAAVASPRQRVQGTPVAPQQVRRPQPARPGQAGQKKSTNPAAFTWVWAIFVFFLMVRACAS